MSRKAIGIFAAGIVALTVYSFLFLYGDRADPNAPYTADDYREGQEQFIELISEATFARFKHNHPPLDCTEAEWEENALQCSEIWMHRFELPNIQPEHRGKALPASERDVKPSPTPEAKE